MARRPGADPARIGAMNGRTQAFEAAAVATVLADRRAARAAKIAPEARVWRGID